MKLFSLLFVSIILSVSAMAEDTAWPLLPDLAEQLHKNTVEDLQIGSFYFYYLNQDYQGAYNHLTDLRTNKQIKPAVLDVLETTLLLALGIEDKALSLAQGIEQTSDFVPAQAWLYLARRWQVIGNWPLAEQAAKNAYESKTRPLEFIDAQEALHILVHCSVELEDTRSANNYFSMMAELGKWTDYARYNLLVGSIAGYASIYEVNRHVEAAEYFFGESEQSLALKDRIYLLGGIYMMEEGRFRNAEVFFQQVRQDSPFEAPALLEYGWAKLEQSRFEGAIQPWRVLQTKYESWHPAVIESILAVPHTMERMQATTQALYSYEAVEKRLLTMLSELNQQQSVSSIEYWLEQWLNEQQGEWGWRRHDQVIDQENPMSRNLMSFLASSSVRTQLNELYDLKRIQQDLNSQLAQLSYWQETAHSRQQYLSSVSGDSRLQALTKRYQALTSVIEDLEQQWESEQKSALAFATQDQKIQIERVKKAVPLIKGLKENNATDVDLAAYMERWRRARGVLVWQMLEERPQRQRLANNDIWQLRQQLALLETQLNHSQMALAASVTSWQGFVARIDESKQKIENLQQSISQLEQRLQQQIVANVQSDLQKQELKLTHYLAEARLALARLYDDHLQQKIITASVGGEL